MVGGVCKLNCIAYSYVCYSLTKLHCLLCVRHTQLCIFPVVKEI